MPGSRGTPLVALLALVVLTAGCVHTDAPEPETEPESTEDARVDDPDRASHSLSLFAWDVSRRTDVVSVRDVDVSPRPEGASVDLGPWRTAGDQDRLAWINATDGTLVDAFDVTVTVHDGLGPVEIVLEVPSWEAEADAEVDVTLTVDRVGSVQVERVEGDLPVDVREPGAEPRYGYLLWPQGDRRPLDGLDRVVRVPSEFPRFDRGAQPYIEADGNVAWTLDGEDLGEDRGKRLEPGPGRHVLALADPDGGGQAELTFSINDRFHEEGRVLAGSGDHRDSLAGLNEDTYNVSVRDGARMLVAQLSAIGNESDLENLDLYALNASGGVVGQSVSNDTHELLRLSRGDLEPLDTVRLKVHGETATATEYRLTGTVFYRPW